MPKGTCEDEVNDSCSGISNTIRKMFFGFELRRSSLVKRTIGEKSSEKIQRTKIDFPYCPKFSR